MLTACSETNLRVGVTAPVPVAPIVFAPPASAPTNGDTLPDPTDLLGPPPANEPFNEDDERVDTPDRSQPCKEPPGRGGGTGAPGNGGGRGDEHGKGHCRR